MVNIGSVPLGGEYPIRVQSMTTVDTMDTIASVEQTKRIIDAGADYVRLTAPSIKDAANLENIKNELVKQGYNTPLIADIHFTPNAAELAAKLVEKVRVNPGNYADKKKFEVIEYTDQTYQDELKRIEDKFTPLVEICKENGTAMRIGTNHGSLSDRIMSRYGDTPLGMVESALEFIRICEANQFYEIVLSMKASNPQVMVHAYRLLVERLDSEGLRPYPMHLGVTEAGEGEDGRIKSAIGIGMLLEDGIGDTVRVSLTEEPEFEIPVAKALVERYDRARIDAPTFDTSLYSAFEFNKRQSQKHKELGDKHVTVVVADLGKVGRVNPEDLAPFGHRYFPGLDKWKLSEFGSDLIYLGANLIDFELPGYVRPVYDLSTWTELPSEKRADSIPFAGLDELDNMEIDLKDHEVFVKVQIGDVHRLASEKIPSNTDLVLDLGPGEGYRHARAFFQQLKENQIDNPVIIKVNSSDVDPENWLVDSSIDSGGAFIDGFGDGIWLTGEESLDPGIINRASFGILQASRVRISKTEYISCPSCGRTLFDLQETTALVRERTDHLKGVKIAIMGCIVNGPGEMADADYGYVGSGKGKITLYRGKEVVKRAVPSENAVSELIDLIREDGLWVEPKMVEENEF